jgi:anti-sigma B factor antagonist
MVSERTGAITVTTYTGPFARDPWEDGRAEPAPSPEEETLELVLTDDSAGPWTVVKVAGELDLHTSPQLRDHVVALIGEPPVRIALDLSEVGFMDSSSLGILVTCLKRVRERDGEMMLVGVTGSPMKVLTLTGLDRVFDLAASSDALPG